MNQADFTSVEVSKLRVGATLRTPIYETRQDRDVLLLTSGVTITNGVLGKLRERGITSVRVLRSELGRLTNSAPKDISALLEREHQALLRASAPKLRPVQLDPNSTEPFFRNIRSHGVVTFEKEAEQRFQSEFQDSLSNVDSFFAELKAGQFGSVDDLKSISFELLHHIAEDIDLFVATGICPESGEYPHEHCLRTSMLAMAIGARMRLNQPELIELSVGCLTHDAGMLQLNPDLYEAERKLTEEEFREIKRHPQLALELVEYMKEFPEPARVVVGQMHERMNGTGYPEGCSGSDIHKLSRIAAVADVFVALVSPRPYRPALLPYYAMVQLIKDRGRGLFDENATRALLATVSMFPIGSFLEMSDGRVGRVIRANGEEFLRPIVELREYQSPNGNCELIDLSQDERLRIIRPLKTPEAA